MPELTSFVKEEAPTVEYAPVRIRRIGTEQEWVLEENGQLVGRLVKSNPPFSLTEEFEFRTDCELWVIRKRFWSSFLSSRSIYSGDRQVGNVLPVGAGLRVPSIFGGSWGPSWIKNREELITSAGQLTLEDHHYTCLRNNLRYDVIRDEQRSYQIQIPWQDTAAKQQICYYLWPEARFQASEYPLIAIMPLFWLGISANDRDRLQQFD